ncbi:MAG: hypothetical protein PUK29_07770 [Fibrobacter sp.]|nr:hypothetical protein [Fibrobacter sp.]
MATFLIGIAILAVGTSLTGNSLRGSLSQKTESHPLLSIRMGLTALHDPIGKTYSSNL